MTMGFFWLLLLTVLGTHVLSLQRRDEPTGDVQWFREEMSNPFSGMMYMSKITVGGQDEYGIFDTGSFDVVVPGSDCGIPCQPDTESLGVEFEAYTINRTNQDGEPELTYRCYGSGCLAVELTRDTVSVADGGFSGPGQVSVIVDSPAMSMNETGGIWGSGPCFTSRDECSSLQAITGVDRYSLCFSEDRQRGLGYLVWNDIDRCEAENAQNIPLDTSLGEWATRMSSVALTVDGRDIFNFGCQGTMADPNMGCYTVLDSGTSLTTLPHNPVVQLLEYLEVNRWNGQMTCQERFADFPDLTFFLGGQQYTLNPMSYVWQSDMFPGGDEWNELQSLLAIPMLPMDPKGAKALRHRRLRQAEGQTDEKDEEGPSPVCFFMLDDSSQYYNEENLAILGMGFFAEYYSTFENRENEEPRICISAAPEDCDVTTEHLKMVPQRTRAKVTNVAESVHKVDVNILLQHLRHAHRRHATRARHYRQRRLKATA